jgi:SSS family solute:Na+ symporter
MERQVHEFFTPVDWAIIVGYLVLTTIVGHLMRGKQGTIRDFFLGGRSLPWPAVCGSIIATEISGVTFIGVAGSLFAIHGNFTYLIWGIGSILGRIAVAKFFVPAFYRNEIYSPYDYMGQRLGSPIKTLASIVFTIGGILGQSVRVFVAAIPLQIVTGLPIWICIMIIGVFAIGWTLMGGMRTVIWTDVMQFLLFTFGGLLALFYIISSIDGSWAEYWAMATNLGKTKILDTRWGFGAELEFTLWIAILAVPFQNMTAFGVDQLNAQRMFCCRSPQAASKALVWSSAGLLLTFLMLLVGTALVVHYHQKPFTPQEGRVVMGIEEKVDAIAIVQSSEALATAKRIENPLARNDQGEVIHPEMVSNVAVPRKPDMVFPMWIVTQLPIGLSGLILAGVFAAAISSLDSILAALSQTTLSLLYHPEKRTDKELEALNLVTKSRWLVVFWGIVLSLFTLLLVKASQGIAVLPLAFGMTTYAMGPLLGLFFCSLIGKGSVRGLITGVVLSFLLVLFLRVDVWVLFIGSWPELAKTLSLLPTYTLTTAVLENETIHYGIRPVFFYGWAWPITTFLTMACGLFIPGKRHQNPVTTGALS